MSGVALDFQKVIDSGRDRKKNEALANKIFSKDRRKSAPGKLKPTAGPSLASRVGVKKNVPQRAISFGRRASVPSGNVNGDWTHDLHHTVSAGGKKNGGGRPITGSLAARISAPGSTSLTSKKAAKKQARIAAALDAMEVDGGKASQINIVRAAPSLTIKGLAGPFAIMGQNFAPGTSAADVESAMTPIGGEMVSCKLIKSQPFVLMEMVFASREGGERVIETFNNQTADGRVIKIYPKAGGYAAPTAASTQKASSGRGQVVDGSHGFAENGSVVQAGNSRSGSGNLFSDKIVGKHGGRGGRGGRGRGRA